MQPITSAATTRTSEAVHNHEALLCWSLVVVLLRTALARCHAARS
ncbi:MULTISPECIES: hypothetical protein [Cupriavidus]|nr:MULTISPECIES: hypothetical protein [Cupriavidus]